MFTKSGSKLVRFSIPTKTDQSSSKSDEKQVHQVNGHIHNILDNLDTRRITETAIQKTIESNNRRNIASSSNNRESTKVCSSFQIFDAKKCTSSSDILSPQLKSEYVNVPTKNETTIPNTHSKRLRNPSHKNESRDKVFTAFQVKKTPTTAHPHSLTDSPQFQKESPKVLPVKQLLTDKQDKSSPSDTNFSKYINGTKYVCYTPKTNVVKRDRLIQANENEIKQTVESAIQCDLIEDESSSESSQSDWINEIIEEYEYLEEDGDMFECNVCGEVCRSHLSSLKHSMTHKESSLLCFRCGRLFPNTSKLLEHEDKMHTEENLTIKKAFRCPKLNCLKAFHSERKLFDHIDQHTNRITEHRCRKCQRLFPSSHQLLTHVNRRSCWR